jgi:hypothetical protein
MYNEIVLTALRSIELPMNELEISSTISQALTDNGYPPIFCLGIFNGGERLFEGVIVNGESVNDGPVLKFTYDWDTDEFNQL